MFFMEGKTKSNIADELGISRFKVARLIEAAVAEGIVKFQISDPEDLNVELAEALRKKYRLEAALVLESQDLGSGALVPALGKLAATYLEETLEEGQVLGVAWGKTLGAAAKALRKLPKVDVVQVTGAPTGLDFEHGPVDLVHRIAGVSGGKAFAIYGPMWVDDPKVIRSLKGEKAISNVVKMFDSLDVLVTGIGSWAAAASGLHNSFPEAWRKEALKSGVVADVCATLIDRDGREVQTRLSDRGLCISSAQIRRSKQIIGVCGGVEKTEALMAALKGGWLTVLITDGAVAKRLLGGDAESKSALKRTAGKR
jgi:DNA-binding transcriptional regulator LsrR (DeoR family)